MALPSCAGERATAAVPGGAGKVTLMPSAARATRRGGSRWRHTYIHMLRYMHMHMYLREVPADKAFYEAGMACKAQGDLNMAFVFLNRPTPGPRCPNGFPARGGRPA